MIFVYIQKYWILVYMSKNRENAEKVWFNAYIYPGKYNMYQINKEIFGGVNNSAYRAIKKEKFIEKGYLRRVPDRRGGREEKILYANIDPIMSIIEKRVSINDLEKYMLSKILNSDAFRNLMAESVKQMELGFKENILYSFDHILLCLSFFAIIHLKNKFLRKVGSFIDNNIKTNKQYDTLVNKFSNVLDNYSDNVIRDLDKSNFLPSILMKFLKDKTHRDDLYRDLPVLFVTSTNLMKKLNEISYIGRLDELFFNQIYSGLDIIEKSYDFDISEFTKFLENEFFKS